METLPAICHAAFVGLEFINKNSPSFEELKDEQEPNRQSKRPGLCDLRSTREACLLWRIAYERRRYTPCMAFTLCGNPRP